MKVFDVVLMVHRREVHRVEASDVDVANEKATEKAHEQAKADNADVRDFFIINTSEVTNTDVSDER